MAKKAFGPTAPQPYPTEMRRQLWPLCCGASIISGFKSVATLTHDELVAQIKSTIDDYVPDLQVFTGETICPQLIFLTLNQDQMGSSKIMKAIEAVGFAQFATAKPRGTKQGFFYKDLTNTFKVMA